MSTERTPLTECATPNYAFQSSVPRRKSKTRTFQCCLCAISLAGIICITVIVASYLINIGGVTPNDEISDAIENGKTALKARDSTELFADTLKMDSPSYRHQKSTATTSKADKLARIGYISYKAAKYLVTNNSSRYNGTHPLKPLCSSRHLVDKDFCIPKEINCTSSKYRSVDGSCNNLKQKWGVAFTKFRRMLAANYADGVGEPRTAINGSALPDASTISKVVHRPTYKNDPKFTVMLAVWGQFMDHDVTATALSRSKNGTAIACCNVPRKQVHPECFPVLYEMSNDFQCMDFVRSAPAASCCLEPREQMNQVSAYLDGSVLYGSEEELSHRLRSFQNGQLDMLITKDYRTLLPPSHDPTDGCNRKTMSHQGKYCFLSGDLRANENIHLTTMHLLLARQHNLIAKKLQELNPNWNDEKLYQETRRIIAAQIQHITFSEFLPIILNDEAMKKHRLLPLSEGYYDEYNDTMDATIANSFAAAAFRFAHTLIPSLIQMLGNDTSSPEYMELHQMLFDPYRLYSVGELDRLLRGAMNTPIEASDPFFSEELKVHLFERDNEPFLGKPCGLDLVALNIQRGRDHGLPGYTSWRKLCGLSIPKRFEDMEAYIDNDTLTRIATLYTHVDDVDLYTGALSEKPIKNSLLGPTATCIITDQFVRMKRGDRFWYENPNEPQAFTQPQLTELRRSTLAAIICDNADDIKSIPEEVMKRGGKVVLCSEITKPDFAYWKES